MKIFNMRSYLLHVVILVMPLTAWLKLPYLGSKLQLSEILFVPTLLCFYKELMSFRDYKTFKVAILWIVGLLAPLLWHLNRGAFLEFIGAIYLCLFTLVIYISLESKVDLYKRLKWFIYGVAITAILGIVGWVLTQCGVDTRLAWPASTEYPYFGKIGRAEALCGNPNMLASYLSFAIFALLFIRKTLKPKVFSGFLILFVICYLLTLSKFVVALIAALCFCLPKILAWRKMQPCGLVMSIAMALSFLFLTHYMILPNTAAQKKVLKEEAYGLIEPTVDIGGNKAVFSTNYSVNKQACLESISRYPIVGLGGGGFNEFVAKLKTEKLYPQYFTNYDPHNTLLGVWAENGFLAFVAMVFIWLSVVKSIMKNETSDTKALMQAFVCYLILEALVTDVMNFRHYWFMLGLFLAYRYKLRKCDSL